MKPKSVERAKLCHKIDWSPFLAFFFHFSGSKRIFFFCYFFEADRCWICSAKRSSQKEEIYIYIYIQKKKQQQKLLNWTRSLAGRKQKDVARKRELQVAVKWSVEVQVAAAAAVIKKFSPNWQLCRQTSTEKLPKEPLKFKHKLLK